MGISLYFMTTPSINSPTARAICSTSISPISAASMLQLDPIELDVQMTRDGHLIVFHDNTVDKLTNGSGNMLDLDFSYLRSLNAAAHFRGEWPEPQRIPTLREVL